MHDLWESNIIAPDLCVANYHYSNNTRRFLLVASSIKHFILADLAIEALGYNCDTPGPLIVGKQGEWIEITVKNEMKEPTALHVHGYVKPNSQDGAPEVGEPTPLIRPGQSYTYRFFLWQSGTFFYHSTHDFQSNEGLVGPLIVLPSEGLTSCIPDRDFIIHLQQWQIPQPHLGKVFPGTYKPNKFGREPNFFTINGKAFPFTSPIYVDFGDHVRIRFINKSNNSHSMHLHGHDFQVIEVDGFPRMNLFDDTINVASGQRWSVEFKAINRGLWPLNGTKTFHQSNNGEKPGGMISRLIYK